MKCNSCNGNIVVSDEFDDSLVLKEDERLCVCLDCGKLWKFDGRTMKNFDTSEVDQKLDYSKKYELEK